MQAVRLAGVVATAALAGFLCGRMKPPAPLQRRRRLSAHAALWPEILKAMERLPELARQRRAAYETARPFPHFYEDGVFPERLLRAVAAELPTKVEGRGCVPGATACFWRKETEKSKSVIDVEARMKPATRLLVAAMKSSAFLRFLEALTGIAALIPDPQFRGSGLHFVGPGGRLAVHADFARYEQRAAAQV